MLGYVTAAIFITIIIILIIIIAILFGPQLGHVLYYLFAPGATVFFEYTTFISALLLILWPPFPPFVYISNILGLLLLLMSFWLTMINFGLAWILGPAGTRPPFLVIWKLFLSGILIGCAAVRFEQYLMGAVSAGFIGISIGLASSVWPFPMHSPPCSFELWYRQFRTFLLPSIILLILHALAIYVCGSKAQSLDLGFVALNIYFFNAILVAVTLNRYLGKYRLANLIIFLILFFACSLAGQIDLAVFTLLSVINYFVIATLIFVFGLVGGVFLAIVAIVITGGIYSLLL